jgi:sodium-dependent dicarboxylate transporter 2/3/5
MWFSGIGEIDAALTLGITVWVVIWWIFEPIPIPATSLLPLALLPLFGVLSANQVGQSYGHPLVLLLFGGFMLATALEKSGAHLRIALNMVRLFGGSSSRRLVFGFMAASALLSMFISNTATTLMLLPVALAVVAKSDDDDLATPLLLGTAYAASIGGMGTPIGTPPNIVFMGVYAEVTGEIISFPQWMMWALPVVLVMLPLAGFWITRHLSYQGQVDLPDVGQWRISERRVFIVFAVTATLWITRTTPFGGWTEWIGFPYSNDAIVALLGAAVLFMIPDGEGGKLMDWEAANRLPWGILILFGAGLSIAAAFVSSGLGAIIAAGLEGLADLPVLLMITVICLSVTFLTEVTSNTATTVLLMPILAAVAVGVGADPKVFMIPAAMSASCAFMLPVATPPNIVVFSTGRIAIPTMVREGSAMNFAGVAVISTLTYLLLT